MGSKIEYVDSSQIYATRYARNSKAIAVLWAVFTVCFAIIAVVAFVTPEWIGNIEGEVPGKFGLWTSCYAQDNWEACRGKLDGLLKLSNVWMQAATVLGGLGCLAAVVAVVAMGLMLFCQSTRVFCACGWLQLGSAICLIVSCTTFPLSWDDETIRKVCNTSDRYVLGDCGIRWAYLLAAIACLDALILATLAFILATRHIRLQSDPQYAPASLYKGEMNSGFVNDSASVAGSRKSLNMHPVMLMHPGQDDTYSQFSQRTVPRSIHSGHYSHPHSLHRNFQL